MVQAVVVAVVSRPIPRTSLVPVLRVSSDKRIQPGRVSNEPTAVCGVIDRGHTMQQFTNTQVVTAQSDPKWNTVNHIGATPLLET